MTTTKFQLMTQQLIKVLGSVIKLASTDITLPVINAVLLRRQGNYLTATATDRYVVGVARDYLNPDLDAPADDWRFAISLADAKALLKLAKANNKTAPVMIFSATELTLTAGFDREWSADNVEVTVNRFPGVGPMLLKVLSRLARTPSVGGLNVTRAAQFTDAAVLCGDRLHQATVWWDASDEPRNGVDQPQWGVKIGEDFVGVVMGLRLAGSRDDLRSVSDWKDLLA